MDISRLKKTIDERKHDDKQTRKTPADAKVQTTSLAKLKAMSDAEIDYSDIPQLGDEFFNKAIPYATYRTSITSGK